jgi:hypothetical protein
MESIMLAVKYVLFYGMELVVLAVVGIVLFAALYQFIRGQVRILRQGPFPRTEGPRPYLTEHWKNR